MDNMTELRARLKLRFIRYLMGCVPSGITHVDLQEVSNYADATIVEVNAVAIGLVSSGMLLWDVYYDCDCGVANAVEQGRMADGVSTGSYGPCSGCGKEMRMDSPESMQVRPEYRLPLWWWKELLPPSITDERPLATSKDEQ